LSVRAESGNASATTSQIARLASVRRRDGLLAPSISPSPIPLPLHAVVVARCDVFAYKKAFRSRHREIGQAVLTGHCRKNVRSPRDDLPFSLSPNTAAQI